MSYRDEVSFSMVASSTVKECESNNVSTMENGKRYLRTAAIYGANGSGKSTLIAAMNIFKSMVLQSFIDENIINHLCNLYYRFDTLNAQKPISMQMIFICHKKRYRYGFEVSQGKVLTEWLYILPENSFRENYCLKREEQNIQINSKFVKGAKGVNSKTRSNALFLSTAAQFNVEIAMEIRTWFMGCFNILSGVDNNTLLYTAKLFMTNPLIRKQILDMINIGDTSIKNVDIKENIQETESQVPPIEILARLGINLPADVNHRIEHHELEIQTTHDLYNNETKTGKEQLNFKFESQGTIKLFALLGPFFDTIQNGGVLVIDEFGASLHTQLSTELLKLFYCTINALGAQLIVTTHDTNLLCKDLLRRDQIWFVEKGETGASDLYSLVEYKINQANSVRNDASFSKDYLLGRYGAIPYFGNIDKFIREYGNQKAD